MPNVQSEQNGTAVGHVAAWGMDRRAIVILEKDAGTEDPTGHFVPRDLLEEVGVPTPERSGDTAVAAALVRFSFADDGSLVPEKYYGDR